MRAHIVTILGCLACLGIGWGIGRLGSENETAPAHSHLQGAQGPPVAASTANDPEAAGIDPSTKTGRVLSSLLAATRQSNFLFRLRDIALAVNQLGPD